MAGRAEFYRSAFRQSLAAGRQLLCVIVLLVPAAPVRGEEIARFNIYDRDFSRLVATAESVTTVERGTRKYSIRYFDTGKALVYEQTVSFHPQTLEIVAGGFIDYRNDERASYAVLDQQASITTHGSDRSEETKIRPAVDFAYSETILARILHDLPALKQGSRSVLHMFVPSENKTIAFEYFLDGEITFLGRSYHRVRARAGNWLYNLFLPRIQFLVSKDGSSIPVFYGPADFYRDKTRGVWIVNRRVDAIPSANSANRPGLPRSRGQAR